MHGSFLVRCLQATLVTVATCIIIIQVCGDVGNPVMVSSPARQALDTVSTQWSLITDFYDVTDIVCEDQILVDLPELLCCAYSS
jgi:hypothetical protein